MGPAGRAKTYSECTALPALVISRFGRLYDSRSRVRTAFTTIGSMLLAKTTVETPPATSATSTTMPRASFRVVRASTGRSRR